MSYSHPGITPSSCNGHQASEQLRGSCRTNQVERAEVALCSNGGAGALFCDVLLLGRTRP